MGRYSLRITIMKELELQFESAGTVQPQLRRDTVDLNIGATANEFERQNRGRERVQEQVRRNQQQMLDNIKTETKNIGMDFEGMKKLANFSQTLTEKVVGYQESKNQAKMMTGYMKAYSDGFSEKEMEKYKAEEAVLGEADKEARKMAADYEANGGQPDVAQELRNMTGWEAYGYAKGMLEKGGVEFSSFLNQRWDKPVMNLNGRPLSLDTAENSAERDMVMMAHKETYIAQYAGLNPKMMGEYLFPSMKKAEAAALIQWDKNYSSRQKAENQGQALDLLNADFQTKADPQFIMDWIDRHQYDLGGMYGARAQAAELVKTLIEDGKLNPNQVSRLFGKDAFVIGKNGNKIRLGSWKEFQGMEQLALDTQNNKIKKGLEQRKLEDRQIDQEFQDILERDGAELDQMSDVQKFDFIKKFKKGLGREFMTNSPAMDNWLSKTADNDKRAELEINQIIENGGTVSESMLTSSYLRAKFGDKLKGNTWAKEAFKDIENTVNADIATALKLTTGEEKTSNRSYTEGIRYARMKALELLQTTRAQNPEMSDEQVKAKVLKDIKTLAGEPGGFKQSPFYYENVRFSTPKEAYLNTLTNSLEYADQQQNAGNLNFLEEGLIPGTQDQYDQLVKNIESGKGIKVPQFYHDIAKTIPGVTGQDVARAQLKAMGGPELVPTKIEEVISTLSPATQQILKGKGQFLTVNRLNRAEVTEEASTANTPEVQSLLDYMVQDESGGNYNIIFGGRTIPGLENMTIQQVIEEQRANVRRTGHGAVGKYQMVRPEEAAAYVGLPLSAKFTKENQDKMAMYYMEMAGYSRFMKGRISAKTFARGLASQWAALHTEGGGTYYKDGTNKAGGSTTYQGLLERIRALAANSPFNAPQNLTPSLR